MPSEDRFKQAIIVTLARRAANRCSNPDCGAITSGPSDDPNKAVNVGEAAHIYGANPGSARYEEAMESADRADITNAIWLCGNCHKLVDDDPVRYPAGLLFEWQKAHMLKIAETVGKAGAELRHRYEARHLEEFGRLSYLAERILSEKGEVWEFQLTGEVLRFEMAPVLRRWEALKRGLYMSPTTRIAAREFPLWLSDRMSEAGKITRAFSSLINEEIQRSWGEPGVPGDEILIVSTCRIYAELCSRALEWEEKVRFVSVHDAYKPTLEILEGAVGIIIDEAIKLPQFIAETFCNGTPSGTFRLEITLALPDGWADNLSDAMQRGEDEIIAEIEAGNI